MREPAPFVTRWRSRTVANGDSITLDVRRCFQCSAGKSKKVSSASASFSSVVTAFGYLGPYIAEGARLRPPFVTLGVVSEAASSYLLPAVIGWQRAAEVLFTADWIDAVRAVELGLASRLCTLDELLPAVCALATRIAAQPPQAVRHTRRLLMATRGAQIRAARAREDQAFVERVGSTENLEAISAFFEKRPLDFSKLSPARRGAISSGGFPR